MTKSIKRMKRLFAWGTALLLVGGMQAALLPVDEAGNCITAKTKQ